MLPSLTPLAVFLKQVVRPEKQFYMAAMLYSMAISLLTLAVPLSVQSLINTVANTALPQSLFALTLLLAILLIIYATLNALQMYVMELFERRFFLRVAAEVVNVRAQGVDPAHSAPFNRFFEVVHIQKSIPLLVLGGFSLFLQSVVGMAVVASYHPFLMIFVMVLIFLLLVAWRMWHRGALQYALELSEQKYAMADFLEHLEHGATPAELAAGAGGSELLAMDYLKARKRFFRYSFSQTLSFLIIYILASVGLLSLGGMLVIHGQLTLGQLVAAELILSTILLGLSKSGYYLTLFYELCSGARKLESLLTPEGDDHAPIEIRPVQPGVWSRIRIGGALKISLRLILLGVVVIVCILTFLPWVQTASGTGRITSLYPDGQPQKIHALVKGRIKKWYVRDGSRVNKDAPIVEIVDNDPMLLERLEAEAQAARKGRDAAQAAAKTALIDLERKKELFERGLAARREWEQARIEYESWLAKEAEAVARITGAETKLSRQQTQLVRAPADGIVMKTGIGDAATMVSEGDTVAIFVPANTVKAAELYLRGLDMPLVQPGRKVRLQFEGWPSVQFSGWPATAIGTFGGVVSVVDPSISDTGGFRILVTEDPQDPWPGDAYLRFGSQVKGWVLLDTVSVGYELWRQMNNFPPENPARRANAGKEKAK